MTEPRIREELKYAHLGHRDTEHRRANTAALNEHIVKILSEVETTPASTGPGLQIAERYRR